MEVKPGYKQTEVGEIPEDWEVKRLGKLASVTAGGTPTRTKAKYWNGDIPWVTTSEVDFQTVNQAQQFITKEGLNNSAAKLLPPGTLLMALYGQGKTRGKVGVLGIEATTNQACAAISLHRGVSGAFVFHFLGSQYEAIRNLSNTGNQENLNNSLVRSISILLPTKAEQEAIAEALSDADALLESLEQLVTKKRHLKQGAMQELLTGKTRLPGFETKPGYKQTEVGVIPEDWEIKTLGSVLFKTWLGGNYPNQDRETNYPLIKMGNIDRGYIDTSKIEYILPHITPDPLDRLHYGDVLFNTRNTLDLVGKVAIWRDELPLAYYNSNLMRLEFDPHEVCSNEYANYAFNSSSAISRLRTLATGTTSVAAIYTRDLLQFSFVLPTPPEQTAIATILSDMDAEIAALETKLTKARQLKQGMMQELLTGRIRLI